MREKIDNFHPHFKEILVAMLKREGRDFGKCELCPATILNGKYTLHHIRYEGATYYDLRIVCYKCNSATANKGLI